MTAKHTPGPWHYAECQMGAPYIDTESVGDVFASVLPLDEERANVRLMAAAPDLLDACEMLAEAQRRAGAGEDGFGAYVDALDKARAAIAKAKGQSTSTDNAMTAAERSMFSMEAERDAARKERDAAQQMVAELRAVLTAGRDIVIETSRRHTRWVEGAYDTLEASAPISGRWCLASERDEALRLLATAAIDPEDVQRLIAVLANAPKETP